MLYIPAPNEVWAAIPFSFLVSFILTTVCRYVANKFRLFDFPIYAHKTHNREIPYLGGLAIVLTTVLPYSWNTLYLQSSDYPVQEFLLVMLFPFSLAMLGLFDDLRNLGYQTKLFFQVIGSALVSIGFYSIGWYGEPTSIVWLNMILTVFWIVFITNSVNFLDNMDGASAGIVSTCAITLGIAALTYSQVAVASLCFVIAGATLGFLMWNFPVAKIFMGDSGSLFLGSLLAVMIIRFDPSSLQQSTGIAFTLLIMAVPIMDTVVSVTSRIARGISPFRGGKDHLAHRLVALGYSKMSAVVILWLLNLIFCLGALATLKIGQDLVLDFFSIMLSFWLILTIWFLRLKTL